HHFTRWAVFILQLARIFLQIVKFRLGRLDELEPVRPHRAQRSPAESQRVIRFAKSRAGSGFCATEVRLERLSIQPLGRGHMQKIERGGKNLDRKSTRLNSSHVKISYAVFCLKKKIEKVP